MTMAAGVYWLFVGFFVVTILCMILGVWSIVTSAHYKNTIRKYEEMLKQTEYKEIVEKMSEIEAKTTKWW